MRHKNWQSSKLQSIGDQKDTLLLLEDEILKRVHENEKDEGEQIDCSFYLLL